MADKNIREIAGHTVMFDPAEIAQRLEHDEIIGFDTETTGFSPWRNNLALIQLYGDTSGTLGLVRTPQGQVPDAIQSLIEDKRKKFVGHNLVNFDIPFLSTHGVSFRSPRWYDTLVGETVIINTGRNDVSKSLRQSARRRLGIDINKEVEHSNWSRPDLTDEQIAYAAEDVIHLPALMRSQMEIAEKTQQTRALDFEMDLLPAVSQMVINGAPFDERAWEIAIAGEHKNREIALERLHAVLPGVNPRSPVKLKSMLLEKGFRLKNTQAETLKLMIAEGFDDVDGTLQRILDFREPDQAIKVYDRDWIDKHVEIDGRIHFKFWQCGTDTTRMASSNPNGQQWPRRLRNIIGNVPGYDIVSGDYSQIEVRIAADIANDEALLEAFSHEDIHTANAAIMRGISHAEVTDEQRRLAKAQSFTLLFGGSPKALYAYAKANGADISMADATNLYNMWFAKYVGLRRTRDRAERMAQGTKPIVIRLPTGHRRILVGWQKTSTRILNTTVQGTAAGGMKHALILADQAGLTKYIWGQLHDELIALVPSAESKDFSDELRRCMIEGMNKVTRAPVAVDVRIGPNWTK